MSDDLQAALDAARRHRLATGRASVWLGDLDAELLAAARAREQATLGVEELRRRALTDPAARVELRRRLGTSA